MGYIYYSIHGQTYSGDIFSTLPENMLSPYNYLSADQTNLYIMNVPVSMAVTVVDPKGETPYQMTVVSPDYYMFVKLNQEEYDRFVLNRGLHMHNTYEMVYTREGNFFQRIEAQRYKYTARSCCILNRNIRHMEEYTTAFRAVTLSLAPEFVKGIFDDPFQNSFRTGDFCWVQEEEIRQFFDGGVKESENERKRYLNFVPTEQAMEGKDFIHDILEQIMKSLLSPMPGTAYIIRGLICRMLYEFSDQQRYSTRVINIGTDAENTIFSKISILMEECYGRISRSELAERLNYSGNYLNRIVKKYTGMSVFQYGNYFAMQRVAWLLLHTDLTVSQIAIELGFSDRAHFYRLFEKEYGVTPAEYRRRYR